MGEGKQTIVPAVLTRRAFLQMGAGFGASMILLGWASDRFCPQVLAQSTTMVRGTARNCLFIVLRGGASHTDTFDLKVGKWTPKKFHPETLSAGYQWPTGIMPQLATRSARFSLVRSLQHPEAVHERAQYFLETAHRLNPGLRSEIPHIGAVVALEAAAKRNANDIFPAFMIFNPFAFSLTNRGFLSPQEAPFELMTPSAGISNLLPADGAEGYDRRRATFQLLDGLSGDLSLPQFSVLQSQADQLMKDPITARTFAVSDSDMTRYGDSYLGMALPVARNVFAANRGTHYLQVDHFDWDHHVKIYEDNVLPGRCQELDQALSALLDDLAALPGSAGKSLLDETLIVVSGEFGRTVGALRGTGRDHYPYAFSALLAGGGVQGGRVIGATDSTGADIADMGWSVGRTIHLTDLAATIYSALGIDWNKSISDTPSGRIFYYTDAQAVGDDATYEISPLF